jgi:hypothetical protein
MEGSLMRLGRYTVSPVHTQYCMDLHYFHVATPRYYIISFVCSIIEFYLLHI